ncbi:cuticle collagen bli-1-like [Ylistrum balloti]|uniref:cuticle collagen bli-1-like n=1 Tax=Ylistrum balloti TaxID=509963 RepID=UPI002905F1F6|nr:cuticle collagen bli-1-like [Ylistrum balloti]
MASDNFRETLQPYCITVEGFPPNTDETSVRQIFTNCLKLENIPGVQPNETKWLMILRDRGEVESFLERSEIHLQNISLKITPCVPCDIPTSWEKFDQQSLGTPGFPIGQPQNFDPYGGYPGPPGHHGYHGLPPTYPNIQYPGNGQYPGQQGTTHLIYAGYPPNYGGPQGPTSMGVRPAGSEGKDHKIYPVASTPPGPQVGQQYHGQVQSQESKLPGVSGEDDHKPLPTDSPRSDLSQDPVKDIDQVSSLKGKESHPSDGRTGQDVKSEEQRKQDAPYLSMPYSYGQPYHGPGQEPMYSMPMYPGQYVPRFQGPFPSHPPPPYHVHPRMHSGPKNSPRMIHPHVPNQSSPYHVPDGGVDSSDTYDNETCGPTTVISEEETDDEREEPLGMIKVTDLPPNITEDSLTLFFENKKKSGGGEIEDVDFRKESAMAILTFKDPEVVDRILQKVPFLLEKKQIKVERFVPESYNSGSIDESPKEETKPSYTIEVRGMKKDTSADTVELYFESKKPAGKFVDVVKFDDSEIDDGVIYVTYETEEVN